MNFSGNLFDAALMMCADNEDKDYKETITMYRDFKDKNYKDNKSSKELQHQFLTENWIKLRGKCPNLMHNYFLLVELYLHPKYSNFIINLISKKRTTPIVLNVEDEEQKAKLMNIYKAYGYDGPLKLSKEAEKIIFY